MKNIPISRTPNIARIQSLTAAQSRSTTRLRNLQTNRITRRRHSLLQSLLLMPPVSYLITCGLLLGVLLKEVLM